jgi:hypothetical protein
MVTLRNPKDMKIKEAIEALRQGKRIRRMPSDKPVDLCDHLGEKDFCVYYQLCHQDKLIKVVPDAAVAGMVTKILTLEAFQVANSFTYVNFALYEEKD